VDYRNPWGGDARVWDGVSDIRIFMKGAEATSLSELFSKGIPSDERLNFNDDEIYLVTFWSSTVRPESGMSAKALNEEGTRTFTDRELVGQVTSSDPSAYPQDGISEGYYYVYKGDNTTE
jgi:hypothetical protein